MSLDIARRSRLAAQPFGLGGAPLGNLFLAVDAATAAGTLEQALASGVRYFDTAPHYGQGLSETRFGNVLRTLPRNEYLLSTKVGRLLQPGRNLPTCQHGYVDVPPLATRYDYSGTGFECSLAASRQRLGIDDIDIVLVHDLDHATHDAEFAAHFDAYLRSGRITLEAMKAAGTIGGHGIGVNGVDIAVATLHATDIDVLLLAGRYTLADQSALPELLPACQRRGVSIVLGGPFNSGILVTGTQPRDGSVPMFDYAPATAALIARVAAIEALCLQHAVPLPAAALQFSAAHPAIAVVLAGARTAAEVAAIAAWRQWPIPAAFWQALRARGLVDAAAPLPGDPR